MTLYARIALLFTLVMLAFSLVLTAVLDLDVGFVVLATAGAWVMFLWGLRGVLQPLADVDDTAQQVLKNGLAQARPLPKTRELRRIVQAFNRLARRLNVMFDEQVDSIERLRGQLHHDPVSGLHNYHLLEQHLKSLLSSEHEPFAGALVRVSFEHFEEYNQKNGFNEGDVLIRQLADIWHSHWSRWSGHLLARCPGASFVALLPYIDEQHLRQRTTALIAEMSALPVGPIEVRCGAGLCPWGMNAHRIEAVSAAALAEAVKMQRQNFVIHKVDAEGYHQMIPKALIEHWPPFLRRSLRTHQIMLAYQPMRSTVDRHAVYWDVRVRLSYQDRIVNACAFFPLIESLDLDVAYDRLIIARVLNQLDVLQDIDISVNVSLGALCDSAFRDWLDILLRQRRAAASHLLVRIKEHYLRSQPVVMQLVSELLERHGVRLCVDQCGVSNMSLSYLNSFPIYAISLDSTYVRELPTNKQHQLFVESLAHVAHSRNILLAAQQVETESQWNAVCAGHVDIGQGYYLDSAEEQMLQQEGALPKSA